MKLSLILRINRRLWNTVTDPPAHFSPWMSSKKYKVKCVLFNNAYCVALKPQTTTNMCFEQVFWIKKDRTVAVKSKGSHTHTPADTHMCQCSLTDALTPRRMRAHVQKPRRAKSVPHDSYGCNFVLKQWCHPPPLHFTALCVDLAVSLCSPYPCISLSGSPSITPTHRPHAAAIWN